MSANQNSSLTYGAPGRSPLFAALRRSANLARIANLPGAPPVAELIERAKAARRSRRDFLSAAAGTVAAAALAGLGGSARAADRTRGVAPKGKNHPSIAIVGAGLAGLNAAYQLKKRGVRATVYSAPERIGGRTFSQKNIISPNLVTEIGGEFVDSGHVDMLSLVKEFGLGLEDVLGPSESGLAVAYEFGGRRYSEFEVITAFRPLVARLNADYKRVGGFPVTFTRNNAAAVRLDRTSLRQYLHEIGATGFLASLLEVGYVTEFGLDAERQSCLNLIFLIGTDVSHGFEIFGVSDQQFKIRGGNDQVAKILASHVSDQIRLGARLIRLRSRGTGFGLTFDTPNGPTAEVNADVVLLAIPFTLLREVEINVALPAYKRHAINNLGYGTNSKLFVGYNGRPWRSHGLTGDSFTDGSYQLSWDNSRPQPVSDGGLTLYSGGFDGILAGQGTDAEQVARHLPAVEQTFPGSSTFLTGRVGRAFWPGEPYVQASYAAYLTGQYTTIAGAEIRTVGNLFFAGEHCSLDSQGYMNGAAQTGRVASNAIGSLIFR